MCEDEETCLSKSMLHIAKGGANCCLFQFGELFDINYLIGYSEKGSDCHCFRSGLKLTIILLLLLSCLPFITSITSQVSIIIDSSFHLPLTINSPWGPLN